MLISTQMLKAAQRGDWQEVEQLNDKRRTLAELAGYAAQVPEAVSIGNEAIALAEAARVDVAKQLTTIHGQQRAAAAYNHEK